MADQERSRGEGLHLPSLEEEMLAFWERERIFERSVSERPSDKQFVFFEGPPTANAKPAIHHVLGRTFKDAIPRYKTMQGYRVERKAGWDTHGLPVELQVEKSLGISGKPQIENIVPDDVAASIQRFNELCKESVWQHKEEWERLTKRMGFWLNMEDPYVTLDRPYIESVWWILKQLWDKELLYEDFKVVPYCYRCGTALSSHEVALGYDEVTDQSVYVKFKVVDRDDTYLLVWTTTPWTLPGNVAVAVNPTISYGEYKLESGERLIFADDRLGHVLFGANATRSDILIDELLAMKYEPLFEVPSLQSPQSFKAYPADFVTTTDGTGIVHIASMYGEDDFQLGNKVGLPKYHTVNTDGYFVEEVLGFGGKRAKDAITEQGIVESLTGRGLLFKAEPYTHTYPFCWRCSTPLIYYAKRSWFIRMSSVRDQLMKNNAGIQWIPSHLKEGRFGEWLREVKDWALSRDRYWGTPLPIWHCDACNHKTCVGSYDELTQVSGHSAPDEVHRPSIDAVTWSCPECSTGTMKRYTDVIDVWFDSGAMPFAQQHYPFERKELVDGKVAFPADYIAEGIDQTRGWFYTLLAISTLLEKGAPYKTVVSYGHLLDKDGKKMSKSKGNVIDPWEAIAEFGIDPIRWYFYSVNQPADTKKFDPIEIQQGTRKVFMIAWNVLNFYRDHAATSSDDEPESMYVVLDAWLRERMKQVRSDVTTALDAYDFFHATRAIREFCTDLSTWYLRLSRRRSDATFKPLLKEALRTISLLLAPFTPFFAEAMWQELRHEDDVDSVHLAAWPGAEVYDEHVVASMRVILAVVEQSRAARVQLGLPLRQPLAAVRIRSAHQISNYGAILQQELNVKNVEVSVVEKMQTVEIEYDTELTDELRAEGLMREVTRSVQGLRKQANMTVGQVAKLAIRAKGQLLLSDEQITTIAATTGCDLVREYDDTFLFTDVQNMTIYLSSSR